MAESYKYSVLQYVPDQRRGERVNIGIVVYFDESVDVRLFPSLGKLLALDANVDLLAVSQLPDMLKDWVKPFKDAEQKLEAIKGLGPIIPTNLGWFELAYRQDYEDTVRQLLKDLVAPIPKIRASAVTASRLTTSLREKFRKQGILGADASDITKHLVVAGYEIDAKEGLYSDFALKNGYYHVTETADFRSRTAGNTDKYRLAAYAAIKLDKARLKWKDKTHQFVVYAAHSDREVQAQLNLLGDYARGGVFNASSKSDMARYMDKMMSAAGRNLKSLRQAARK